MENTKIIREEIKNKYNGKCAYTGKDLGNDWQIDHIESKVNYQYASQNNINSFVLKVNNIDNLVPALKIVNHYKRGLNLEGFRNYMLDFHKRLAKLPKQTRVAKTKKRIEYMNNIANAFDISVDKPFFGKFYFEILEN